MNETTRNCETESICSSWCRCIILKLCAARSSKNKTIDIDDWCHNYCFQCSVFINWARMQHPFLFVQDCSSETSEKVLVDKLNRFFLVKEILRGLCVFLRWHLVTATSEGKQLCYYVPETLHNIFERFCTKKPQKVFNSA